MEIMEKGVCGGWRKWGWGGGEGGGTGTAGGDQQEKISPILHTCVADSASNHRC